MRHGWFPNRIVCRSNLNGGRYHAQMIVDRRHNWASYRTLGSGIHAAFDYLEASDFSQCEDGRIELGNGLIAIVQRYWPKHDDDAVWEAHRRFVDVQYVVRGIERMGWCPLGTELSLQKAYDEERDAVFFEAPAMVNFVEVQEGGFAIFLPQDVHAPGLAPLRDSRHEILKVVVKVPVELIG